MDETWVEHTRKRLPDPVVIFDAVDVFGLLADPGRLRLLAALLDGEASVGDLAAVAGLTDSAASHALRLLRAHRVVAVRRAGRAAYYRLDDAHVRMLLDLAFAHTAHREPDHSGSAHLEHDSGHPERAKEAGEA